MLGEEPAAPDIVLSGNIDGVSVDCDGGIVTGWCWSPDEPATRRLVCLVIDGIDISETLADQLRADLASAGVGDGAHGFTFHLGPQHIPAEPRSRLALRDIATARPVGGDMAVDWPQAAPPAAPALPTMPVGNLEEATQEGWVSGWAWYPDDPDRRVNLDILVDGVQVGSARAGNFRADLRDAGIGDGGYGFSFALPWSVLARKGEMTLSARDSATGSGFGEPFAIRIGRLVDVEERMAGLERQVRMLQARLAEQEAAADPRREARAARELFRTVAAFFHDMAAAPDPAQPAGTLLRRAVASVLDAHAPFAFEVPERPVATLLLGSAAKRPALYDSLVALREAGADRIVDIVLIDDGSQGADLALLPAIVRNLRYIRLKPGADMAAACNDAAAAARGDAIVMLSPHVRIGQDALSLLLATVTERHGPVLAAAAVLRADGRLDQAGYAMHAQSGLVDLDWAEDPLRPDLTLMRPVDAVAELFFAVRRGPLLEAGGFPTGYEDPARAVAGLCFALRGRGHAVAWQPGARATLLDGLGLRRSPPSAEDATRLREQWAAIA